MDGGHAPDRPHLVQVEVGDPQEVLQHLQPPVVPAQRHRLVLVGLVNRPVAVIVHARRARLAVIPVAVPLHRLGHRRGVVHPHAFEEGGEVDRAQRVGGRIRECRVEVGLARLVGDARRVSPHVLPGFVGHVPPAALSRPVAVHVHVSPGERLDPVFPWVIDARAILILVEQRPGHLHPTFREVPGLGE